VFLLFDVIGEVLSKRRLDPACVREEIIKNALPLSRD
jgi:hypothetical protein